MQGNNVRWQRLSACGNEINLVKSLWKGLPTAMKDITNREDIELLVRKFYGRMMDDPIIGFFFTYYAKINLESHLPVISDFWETVLFQKPVYEGGAQAMNLHIDLNNKVKFRNQHFTRWLYLFHRSVDELFDGPNAVKAKERSASIAELMKKRMGVLPDC
jgi:hemoglobin